MVRAKAGLLASLVICSLALSALIIFGQPVPNSGSRGTGPWFGPKPGLHEISLPGRIYICSPNQGAILIETLSQTYSDLVLTLGQMEYGSEKGGDVWVTGEYTSDSITPGVLFRYDYQISRGLLANWLTMFYETDFPFAAIDSIFVPLDGGPVKFINSATGVLWQLQADLPLSVFQQAAAEPRNPAAYPMAVMGHGETYSVAAGIFDLVEAQEIAVPACQLEEVRTEDIIHSFFLNPSIIQEADGTETYTDGFGALRIFPSGALEYTSGRQGQGAVFWDQPQLMQATIDFLVAHGGWPGNMLPVYLSNRPGESVSLEFCSFSKGLPITGENVGIAVEFQQDQVSDYQRHLALAAEEAVEIYAEIKPLAWHLASDSQAGQFFAEGNKHISDLALAFYWQQDRLIPVWRVWTGNQVVHVAASDGRILQIKIQLGGQ